MATSKYKIERDQMVEKLQAVQERIANKDRGESHLAQDIDHILSQEVGQFAALRDAEVWEEGFQAGLKVTEEDSVPVNPYRKAS